MKWILAAPSAALLAGAVLVSPVSAQTWNQPYSASPALQPGAGQTANPYGGATTSPPYVGDTTTPGASTAPTTQASLPPGSYLQECREVRMLQGTLTAFCPRGDGTWHTTQLIGADRCSGNVSNAGGDLVCAMPPQIGSAVPPQGYVSSAGGTYGGPIAAPPYPPAPPAPVGPAPAYAAPAYPSVPSQSFYMTPSAARRAQPSGY